MLSFRQQALTFNFSPIDLDKCGDYRMLYLLDWRGMFWSIFIWWFILLIDQVNLLGVPLHWPHLHHLLVTFKTVPFLTNAHRHCWSRDRKWHCLQMYKKVYGGGLCSSLRLGSKGLMVEQRHGTKAKQHFSPDLPSRVLEEGDLHTNTEALF